MRHGCLPSIANCEITGNLLLEMEMFFAKQLQFSYYLKVSNWLMAFTYLLQCGAPVYDS